MYSENNIDLTKAQLAAQAEFTNASFNQDNPYFNSRYADLAQIREVTLPVLQKHELVITHTIAEVSDGFAVRGWLVHAPTGQYLFSDFPLPKTYEKPQAIGGAVTYGRRYTWGALCGIATEEDDDGNSAQGRPAPASSAPPAQTRTPIHRPAAKPDQVPGAIPRGDLSAIDWGREFIGAIDGAKSAVEIDDWITFNESALKVIANDATKVNDRINARIAEALAKFPGAAGTGAGRPADEQEQEGAGDSLPTLPDTLSPADTQFFKDANVTLGVAKTRKQLDAVLAKLGSKVGVLKGDALGSWAALTKIHEVRVDMLAAKK